MSNINSFFLCVCWRSDVRDRAEENNYKSIVNKSNKWNHNLFIIYFFVSPFKSHYISMQIKWGSHTNAHIKCMKLQQYGYGDAQKRHTIRVTAAQNQKTNECKAYATHCALKQNLIFVIHSSHLPLWNNLLFFPLSSWTCEMLLRCVHICDSERKEQEKNTKDDNDNKKRNLFTHHTIGSIIFMVLHAQQNWTFFPSFIQSFSSIPFRLCGARSMDSKRIHVYLWHMCMLSVCDIFHSFKINIGIKLS